MNQFSAGFNGTAMSSLFICVCIDDDDGSGGVCVCAHYCMLFLVFTSYGFSCSLSSCEKCIEL